MSQTDVLVELIRHATAGNQPAIRQSVERLIADEEQKGHRILAERLQKALQAPHTPSRTPPSPFSGQGGAAPQQALYYETQPARRLDSLVLAPHISAQIRELVEEQQRIQLLHAHNLCARHRVLLAGPPGNGKTSLAEALAIVRRIVLAGTAADSRAITRVKLEQWQQRLQPLTAETTVVPVRKQRRRRGTTQEALPI